VERRQASALESGRAAQAALSVARPVRRLRTGHGILRLPAFRFFSLFAGSEPQRVAPQQLGTVRSGLDGFGSLADPRITGGGEQTNTLFDITRAPVAPRDWDRIASAPTKVGEGDHAKRSGGGL
jgi:hypothetical protein